MPIVVDYKHTSYQTQKYNYLIFNDLFFLLTFFLLYFRKSIKNVNHHLFTKLNKIAIVGRFNTICYFYGYTLENYYVS